MNIFVISRFLDTCVYHVYPFSTHCLILRETKFKRSIAQYVSRTEHAAQRTEQSALRTEHRAQEPRALSTEHRALSTEHRALSTKH